MQSLTDVKQLFRQSFFPSISDWKSNYNEYRDSYFVKTDSMIWIFFNKKGSKIVYYSTLSLSLVILGVFTYLSFLWNIISFLLFCFIDFSVIKWGLRFKKQVDSGKTFYDLFLREYDVN